jgi:4-amino-4-deoxy-L-arabinose transferase-like glycosyltransferase
MSPRFVVALAVALRVGWVLAVPTRPVGDFAMYLESATHLLSHRAFDPEFVYMPGYVGFIAGLLALGAGPLAIKLVTAVGSGLAAGAVYGVGAALWERRAGAVAGLAYALWPAGIAVSSVTGTDLPAAVLLVTAVWLLARFGPARPFRAAIAFGLVMGLASTLRAVMVPLAAFSFFYFAATGRTGLAGQRRWLRAFGAAGLATAVALVVLAPWAYRNHRRYGDWFLTDSHGGLTALVGANPNSDGRYSRSLNRLFAETSGYRVLGEPHRQADRASYAMARQWVAASPAYELGLVELKAERLLREQRPLLYWPLYRAGVLQPGRVKDFVDGHRAGLERVVDVTWWTLAGFFLAGVGLALARRRWDILWFLPMALALVGIYALFFAEARYQLPIVVLMFPVGAGTVVFLRDAVVHFRRLRRVPPGLRREAGFALAVVGLMAGLLPALSWAGAHLRERHRFAVQVCTVDGQPRTCLWHPDGPGDSLVRGVWNGVGVRLGGQGEPERRPMAHTELELPAGRYTVRGVWDVVPAAAPSGLRSSGLRAVMAGLHVGETTVARESLAALVEAGLDGREVPLEGVLEHAGGKLRLVLEAGRMTPELPARASLWLSKLSLERQGADRTGPQGGFAP